MAELSKSANIAPLSLWRPPLAAMCALLAGIGLARFAYTPLLPALVTAGWLAPADAAYLGAANLLGYLAGALIARWAARRMKLPPLLRAMMLATALSLLLSALPLGFFWLLPWRIVTGIAGAFLMVLAPPAALAHVPHERRGLAGGIILTGVGLGIAAFGRAHAGAAAFRRERGVVRPRRRGTRPHLGGLGRVHRARIGSGARGIISFAPNL